MLVKVIYRLHGRMASENDVGYIQWKSANNGVSKPSLAEQELACVCLPGRPSFANALQQSVQAVFVGIIYDKVSKICKPIFL